MVKQPPSFGRILVMAGFALSVFGLLLFLWLAFGGPVPLKAKGYRFDVAFKEATALAPEADVRISGVPVGRVRALDVRRADGATVATIEIEPRYAPLPSDARAILRQKTLLGETYIEMTPGSKGAPAIPDGGELAATRVAPTVELDEILRAFDPGTRERFKTWMAQQALALDGRGRELSEAIGSLGPLADQGERVFRTLNTQRGAVRRLVRSTGEVFAALTERDGQLGDLIVNSNRVFSTTAARDRQLADAVRALPTFQRESQATVSRLRRFAQRADPLVRELTPAARELTPALIDLARTSPDLLALFRDLDPLITASRRGLPATERLLDDARPVLRQADPALRQVNPMAEFLSRYKRELTAFFANTVASTQASDQPPKAKGLVHYLRTLNPLNLENLSAYPSRVASNRPNPYQQPDAFDQLARGLPVYEDRQCGAAGIPALGPAVAGIIPEDLRTLISTLVFKPLENAAYPPCVRQGQFEVAGLRSDFPQVAAGRPSTSP